MRTGILTFAAVALLPVLAAVAAEQVVHFKPGATSATLDGTIKGYDGKDYRVGAKAGQAMSVLFEPNNQSCYFNVLPPGSNDVSIFTGSNSGNEFAANLEDTGDYVIRVYLMRNAARRNEQCKYKFTVEISAQATEAPDGSSNDALVPGTNFNATSDIPCSRVAGQPSTRCRAGVVRRGDGNSDVTVFWPDGGSRTLFFKGGEFTGADSSEADGDVKTSSSLENGLYLIRVGEQRFEVPDVLVVGD
ncbi:hypothetical protein SAMN05892877_106276 [Rhizobium subbaraonis]|uniref:DNA breaking-rejoining protein n=2 Tax=Rhizobium subbaraonis TaxID=908946 RepID=A0A285UI79_9HYPH|nr:hypothetical protein SAMN05892877_106276 [Rhizobium subbaraonis]